MYTSGRTVKSKARKPAGLTVAKATADARRVVGRVMPNAGATVESKLSHDLKSDQPIVVTVITFSAETPNHLRRNLADGIYELTGYWGCDFDVTRATVTRRVANA